MKRTSREKDGERSFSRAHAHSMGCRAFGYLRLESGLDVVWKKYQVFSAAAELFLSRLQEQLQK